MANLEVTESVRASRDGDQFHYHWAARQALKLLGEGDRPLAITVEGVSELDDGTNDALQAIDLAEYWGSEDPHLATKIIYRQFKHSTLRAGEEWTVSFLKKTIQSFAKKFQELLEQDIEVDDRVSFELLTNRPGRAEVKSALRRAGHATSVEAPVGRRTPARYLWDWASEHLSPSTVSQFYVRFSIHDDELPIRDLRSDFIERTGAFLPGAPVDQPLRLKELVQQSATNLAPTNAIRRQSVLVALGVTEEDLLPAPCELTRPATVVVPPSWAGVRDVLLGGESRRAVVHASGGMGKSVFAGWLPNNLPDGWEGVVFDCFANGTYRSVSAQRHEHRRALVQISNELAARMLCTPVIPSPTASPTHYMQTFRHRLEQAQEALAQRQNGARLVLIVDAADNSVLAARSQGSRSFAPDLLREELPAGVILVMLARTERLQDLDVPPDCVPLELGGFSSRETEILLTSRFSSATHEDSEEFHHQTSGVPRVQAMVLDGAESLGDALRSLGEARKQGPDILDSLLSGQVAKARDLLHDHGASGDQLCTAMATLPPRVPVPVLSALCDLPESAVVSFAADVGRSVLVTEGHLQFRDEPTETWFRNRFRPEPADIPRFVEVLSPLAATQPYVAGALPQLMLEGGQFDALVALALGEDGLPDSSEPVRLEIMRNRTQLAVRAALRAHLWFDAGRLALRAATLEAGRGRRHGLIRRNPDLAGEFLPDEVLQNLLASRALAGGWPGSNLHVEACLLAHSSLRAQARAKVRSATEWMHEWVRSSSRKNYDDDVTYDDVAEAAMAVLRVLGPEACAAYLRGWRPPALQYEVGLVLARRLSGRSGAIEISDLVVAGIDVRPFALGLARVAFEADITLTQPAISALCDLLKRTRRAVDCGTDRWGGEIPPTGGVVWAVAHGLACHFLTTKQAVRALGYYLPKTLSHSAGENYRSEATAAVLYGYSLLSRLEGTEFDPWEIAPSSLREDREKRYVTYRSVDAFNANILPLARWASTHLQAILSEDGWGLDSEVAELAKATFRGRDYSGERPYLLAGWGSRVAASLIRLGVSGHLKENLFSWCLDPRNEVSSVIRTNVLARLSGVPSCAVEVVKLAAATAADIETVREDAGERANDLVVLARAICGFSPDEARAYFEKALAIADRMGEEVWERWRTQIEFSHLLPPETDAPRAYRLGQMAESLEPYLADGHDWRATVKAIAHLHPVGAIAVVSRWRTRRTEGSWAHIPALTDPVDGPLSNNALASLGLVALDDSVALEPILQAAVDQHPGRRPAIERATRQFEHRTRDAESDATSSGYSSSFGGNGDKVDQQRVANADRAYRALDLTSVAGWEQAEVGMREHPPVLDQADLIGRAMAETPLNQLGSVIRAFKASSWPTPYAYNLVFSQLEQLQTIPLAVREEARGLALEAAARFCVDISARYRSLELARIQRLTGITPRAILEIAFEQLGYVPGTLTAVEHLLLARALAGLLSGADVAQLFDYSSQQFEELAPLDALDGPAEQSDPLPLSISQALAALVWVSLSDPAISDRWRAAHVVYRWVELGCTEELGALAALASSADVPRAFIDNRLPFYRLHAVQWLLFGLARGAMSDEGARSTAPFRDVVLDLLLRQPPHAVIQAAAGDIVRRWQEAGAAGLGGATYEEVAGIGRPIGLIQLADDDVVADDPSAAESMDEDVPGRIFWDFEAYWCRPLGEVFGLGERAVLKLVHQAIDDERSGRSDASIEDDPRRLLKLYGSGAWSEHGEWPAQDDLEFYHAVHGLYRVAGQLIASTPMVTGRFTESDHPYRDWISEHQLSRADGRWLADRRDSPPHDRRSIAPRAAGGTREGWLDSSTWGAPWSRLQHGEFLTVHENSTIYSLEHREHVRVVSALVDPQTSKALLRALRDSPKARALVPIDPNDRWERTPLGKKFEAWRWIVFDDHGLGVDRYDPHANGIRFPPPRLAPFVAAGLDLTPDLDERDWVDSESFPRVRTTVWNDMSPHGRDQEGPEGDMVELHANLILSILNAAQRDLVIEITVTREERHDYAGRDDDDRERRISDYFLVRAGATRLLIR